MAGLKLTREIVLGYEDGFIQDFTATVYDGVTFTIQVTDAPGPVVFVFTDEQGQDPEGDVDQFEGDGNGKAVIGPDSVTNFADNDVKNVSAVTFVDGYQVPVAQGVIAKAAFSRASLAPAAVDNDMIVDGGTIIVDNGEG